MANDLRFARDRRLARDTGQARRNRLLLPIVALLAGCASHGHDLQMRSVESHLAGGSPEQALSRLSDLPRAERDRGLYEMDRGMILRMAGDIDGSIAALSAAQDILGELEAISLSETAGSLLLAEQVRSYSGEIHERILLHVFQALNYLELGDLDSALVEARRIDLGLRRIDSRFGQAPHGGDGFARYLAGLIHEAAGEPDDARIAYRHAVRAYRAYRPWSGRSVAVPDDLARRLARLSAEAGVAVGLDGFVSPDGNAGTRDALPPGWGEVFVVVHNGLAAGLESRSLWVRAADTGDLYRVSLPVLRPRAGRAGDVVVMAGDASARAETVEDIDRAAGLSLEARKLGLTARSLTRNVARARATRAAREEDPLLGFLVNVFGVVMEVADTRSWRTLPATIELVRLPLPAGTHDVAVELQRVGGMPAGRRDLGRVTVAPGSMEFRSVHWVPAEVSWRRSP